MMLALQLFYDDMNRVFRKIKKPTIVMDDLHIIEPRRVNILEPRLSTIVDFVSKSKSAFLLTSFLGAENETRTRDPNLGKVMLYQLSYFRILLPVLVVWDCKGTHFFLTSKLFCKNFYIF